MCSSARFSSLYPSTNNWCYKIQWQINGLDRFIREVSIPDLVPIGICQVRSLPIIAIYSMCFHSTRAHFSFQAVCFFKHLFFLSLIVIYYKRNIYYVCVCIVWQRAGGRSNLGGGNPALFLLSTSPVNERFVPGRKRRLDSS